MNRKGKRFLPFIPSLATGILGALWLYFFPVDLGPRAALPLLALTTLVLTVGLLGSAWLLERLLPSFRTASRLLEHTLGWLRPSGLEAFLLATLTATAEELFFRGALQSLVGVWGQALVFGLLHPMPRRAWSSMVYAALSGLALGYAAQMSGSLWPGIVAHFLVNFQGFWELRRQSRKRLGRV